MSKTLNLIMMKFYNPKGLKPNVILVWGWLRVQDALFRVYCSVFRVQCVGFRV